MEVMERWTNDSQGRRTQSMMRLVQEESLLEHSVKDVLYRAGECRGCDEK